MPTIDGASLNGLLSTPLVLGALAALLVVLLVLAVMRNGVARRLLLPVAMLVVVSLGVMAILDRMAQDERAAERRALAQRDADSTAQALAPGSALACLDGAAGEAVENACEKTVFAGPQSTAAAVAYMAARLTLLADGLAFARRSDPDFARNAFRPAPRHRARPLRSRRPCAGGARRLHRRALRRLRAARQCERDQGQSQGAGVRPIRLALCRGLEQDRAGGRPGSRLRRPRSRTCSKRRRRPRYRTNTISPRPLRSRR